MKHHPDHPCGAIPVSQWSVTVWFCHAHQAWFASAGGFTDPGTDQLIVTSKYTSVEFGPFDSVTDVQHWVQSQLPGLRHLTRPIEGVA